MADEEFERQLTAILKDWLQRCYTDPAKLLILPEYMPQILTLIHEAGYRKIEGEPPILSDNERMVALEDLQAKAIYGEDIRWDKVSEVIARRQVGADIKWLKSQ